MPRTLEPALEVVEKTSHRLTRITQRLGLQTKPNQNIIHEITRSNTNNIFVSLRVFGSCSFVDLLFTQKLLICSNSRYSRFSVANIIIPNSLN
jgi:hypothetical protein